MVAAAGLTARELEIVGLVAQGYTRTEIAHRLTLSIATVRNHLTHIYTKLGLHSQVDLYRYAVKSRMDRKNQPER